MDAVDRLAWVVILGEIDGSKFNWTTLRFDIPQPEGAR